MKAAEPKTTTASQSLQTKSEEQSPFFQPGRAGEAVAQSEPFFSKPAIQPKLKVGQPGDKYEQEADAKADEVVQRLQRKPIFESDAEPSLQPSIQPRIQPKCAACEEEEIQKKEETGEEEQLQMKPIFDSAAAPADDDDTLQAKSESSDPSAASPGLESQLQSSKGGGSPLPENTRSQMEGAFGSDFSGVRVHTDSPSVQMNRDLGAQAFTHGSDVYFNSGKYDTGSTEGQRLLGHELTHVVQQGGVSIKKKKSSDGNVPNIQAALWEKAISIGKGDKCKENEDKGKGEGKDEPVSNEECPQVNPPAEQPKEGQKEPDGEETPVAVGAQEGASVEDRQANAPPPDEKEPDVPSDATEEAQEESLDPCELRNINKTGSQDLNDNISPEPNDTGLMAKPGAEKGEKGEEEAVVSSEGGKSAVALNGLGIPETVKPEGIGEAASPELLEEKTEKRAAANSATSTLLTTMDSAITMAREKVQFLKVVNDEGADDAVQVRHTASTGLAQGFVNSSANKLSQVIGYRLQEANKVREDADVTKASIQTKISERRDNAKASISKLKVKARNKAIDAESKIISKHINTVAQIETSAKISATMTMLMHMVKVQAIEQKRKEQLTEIEKKYNAAYADIKDIGRTVGEEASSKGEKRAQAYERAEGVTDQKVVDKVVKKKKDGFWDGYLTYNRYKARAKSAREVAKQYKDGMITEAEAQAEHLMCDKSTDIDKINVAADAAIANLQCTLDTALEGIEATRKSKIQSADELKTQKLGEVRQALVAALTKHGEQEAIQLQFLNDYGVRQAMVVERDADDAIFSILSGANNASSPLLQTLLGFKDYVASSEAPAPEELSAHINQLEVQISNSIGQIDGVASQGLVSSRQALNGAGIHTLSALDKYGEDEIATSRTMQAAFEQSINNLVVETATQFDELTTSATSQINDAFNIAISTFDSVLAGLAGMFVNLNTEIDTRFEENKRNIEGGMRDSITKDLDNKISCEAEKAAKEVQPWWKKVLKILLVVLVVVIMIVVLGPAGGLLALVVKGAVAGAVAGAVIQIGDNLIDNIGRDKKDRKSWHEGVGKAMVVGAIGGAFGAFGGHIAMSMTKVAQGATATLGQHVLRGGIELAFDTGGGVLGDLAVGNPITLESVALGAAIGAGVNVGVGGLGGIKNKISGAGKSKVVGDAPVSQGKSTVESGSPKVKGEHTTNKPKESAPGKVKTPKDGVDLGEVQGSKVRAEHDLGDGHKRRVSEKGVEVCSDCSLTRQKFNDVLSDNRYRFLADELDNIEAQLKLKPDSKRLIRRHQSLEKKLEAARIDAGGGHAFGDHGPHVTSAQQKHRLTSGETPSGRIPTYTHGPMSGQPKIPNNASNFSSAGKMLEANRRVIDKLNKTIAASSPPPLYQRIEITMPGGGVSISASGAVVPTQKVLAFFKRNASSGNYDMITMYPSN